MQNNSESDILDRVRLVFRDVFEDPSLTVDRDSNAETVEGWDSLAHVNLVAAVEETFGIRFSLGEVLELQNVGDMVDLVLRKAGGP